ncbi:hypothetical protein E2493_02615 [Sphingomonas parva]|uniref:Uncharacterized protein n=1 Tax=Sphingomonas parva TaxID=2555898 RepID=A0A4Y8ZUQ6_9SPHN|nr:hypothetical protein [Sphingomonas parva]TFI59750.1 hypothetical protein E2493_02615 [Sphingomonas parva]
MVLSGDPAQREAFAAAMVHGAEPPWSFDPVGSEKAGQNALGQRGVLIFQRAADERVPAARLVLWPQDGGYYVPNVTPVAMGQFTISQYNAVLDDFANAVARPVARRFGFGVGLTAAIQSLDDWLPPEAAAALRRFSAAANKSSGASHPLDERRWFDFIIAVHRCRGQIGSDRLGRWLHEVEGWDEDSSHHLVAQFERGLALLSREEETR